MKELTAKQNRKIAISLYILVVCNAILAIFSVATEIIESGSDFQLNLITYILLSSGIGFQILASEYWRKSKTQDDNSDSDGK